MPVPAGGGPFLCAGRGVHLPGDNLCCPPTGGHCLGLESAVIELITTSFVHVVGLLPMDITITPNDSGLPGISQLRTIVGAIMTVGLILSVLALIISAIVWGFGANSSNPHLASRGKVGVLVSCGAAVICGASVALINFFWNVGQSV